MSIAHPRPPIAWAQNVSASFGQSGTISVQTKFRQVDSYWIQPIMTPLTASMQGAMGVGFIVQTSKNAGTITAQLLNASTQVSSSFSAYIWATGVM